MKLPNKVTSYQESVLSKLTIILDILSVRDLSLIELSIFKHDRNL